MNPISFTVSDDTTPLTAGAGKVTYRMPVPYLPAYVSAGLTVAQASGSIITIDVNRAGTSILSTKLSIDNTEKTSVTAAVQPVMVGAGFAFDQELTIDVDQIGNGSARGLKVTLYDEMPTLPAPEDPPPPPDPPTETLIDRTLGTAIGNLTVFGLAKAFDGVTNATGGNCAAKSASGGYVGKTFPEAKIFSRALVYGANDRGFVANINPSVTIRVYGKNGTPVNETDGTLIGGLTFTDTGNESAGREITSIDTTNAYTSIWASITPATAESTYCAELVLYELA